MGPYIAQQAEWRIAEIDGVEDVEVEMVYEPPWNPRHDLGGRQGPIGSRLNAARRHTNHEAIRGGLAALQPAPITMKQEGDPPMNRPGPGHPPNPQAGQARARIEQMKRQFEQRRAIESSPRSHRDQDRRLQRQGRRRQDDRGRQPSPSPWRRTAQASASWTWTSTALTWSRP